jgi:hypothetical protein
MAMQSVSRRRLMTARATPCGLRFFVVVARDFWHLALSWYRRFGATLVI